MKKVQIIILSMILFFGLTGLGNAIPFQASYGNSNVLDEGESCSFDFIQFYDSGLGFGTYNVSAVLAFDTPTIDASFGGSGSWWTFLGFLSGGTLTLEKPVQQFKTDGYNFEVAPTTYGWDLYGGGISSYSSSPDNFYITHYSTRYSPKHVPEPGIFILFGVGLLGLFAFGRKKSRA